MLLKKLLKLKTSRAIAMLMTSALLSMDLVSPICAAELLAEENSFESVEDSLAEADSVETTVSSDEALLVENEGALSGVDTPVLNEWVMAENESGTSGDDDIDGDEDQLVERGDISYNVTAMTSALDGAINDSTAFSASIAVMKEKPVVKLKWKIKDSASATLYRLNADGLLEVLDVRAKKKVYTDTEVFEDTDTTSIYFLRSFSKEGVETDYVTVPSTAVLSCDGGTIEETIQFVIGKATGPVRYIMQRTNTKDKLFAEAESYNVYDSDIIDQSLSITGADIKAVPQKCFGRNALAFTDKEVKAEETYMYRFISEIDLPGIHVTSIPTKPVKAKTSFYAAPQIGKVANANAEHTLCYTDGTIFVTFPDGYPDIDAVIEVERAGTNGKFKKIIKENFEDLTKTTINGVAAVKINYDKFDPEIEYYYRARYSVGNKKSGASVPFEATCHYEKVKIISSGELDSKKIGINWLTDECALRYDIYRTEDVWDSASKALEEAANYDIKQFKKVKTYKTAELSAGTKISDVIGNDEGFVDTNVELGVYHAYRVVPVNKKMPEFTSPNVPLLACKAYPASPSEVTFTPAGMHQVNINWSRSTGATVYKIQRTDTADYLGNPIWDEDEYDTVNIREWEFEHGEEYTYKDYSDVNKPEDKKMTPFDACCFIQNEGTGADDLVKGQHYYYRVLAACKVDDIILWADENTANYVEVYLQPKPVTGFNATLMSTASSVTVNYAKLSFGVPDDYEKTVRYEVTYSIGDKSGFDSHISTSLSYNGVMAPGTAVTKQYSGITRGKTYYFAVRPVYTGSDMTITGTWQEIKFLLPVEVFVYPEGSKKNFTNDSTTPININTGGSKIFYLEYDPSDATFLDTTVTLSSTSYFELTYDPEKTKKGKHYFTIKAKSGYSYSYSAYVTVTAVNYSKTASGDVASQLKKTIYLKMIGESTTS